MDDEQTWNARRFQRSTFNEKQHEDQNQLKNIHQRLQDCSSRVISPSNRTYQQLDINNKQAFNLELEMNGLQTQDNQSFSNQNFKQNQFEDSSYLPCQLNMTQKIEQSQSRHFDQSDQPNYTFNDEQLKPINNNKKTNINSSSKLQDSLQVRNQKTTKNFVSDANKIGFMNKDFQRLTQIRKKMTEFFLTKTYSGRTQLLTNPKIQSFLNDKCDIRSSQSINCILMCYKLFFELMKLSKINICKYLPIFKPQHPAVFITNILFCIFNCSFYTFLSIVIVFQAVLTDEFTMYAPIYGIWIVEILFKLNTAIYVKTELILTRQEILQQYIKQNALYDILPFLLSIVKPSFSTTRLILEIISFVKLKNIVEELTIIQKQLCMAIQKYYYLIQLINLILQLFLVAHAIACLWYLLGKVELYYLDYEDTWYTDSIGADGTWWKLYLQSFYWSLTLMATGSNEAATPLQTFFTSFFMLFTTIIFGYFLNIIGIILSENDEEEINQRKDINIINKYMRKRNISSQNIFQIIKLNYFLMQ